MKEKIVKVIKKMKSINQLQQPANRVANIINISDKDLEYYGDVDPRALDNNQFNLIASLVRKYYNMAELKQEAIKYAFDHLPTPKESLPLAPLTNIEWQCELIVNLPQHFACPTFCEGTLSGYLQVCFTNGAWVWHTATDHNVKFDTYDNTNQIVITNVSEDSSYSIS